MPLTAAATPAAGPGAGGRVASVDALRGLVITLMIFVNDVSAVPAAPAWLKHAHGNEDKMTLPDVVFPGFLFIAGMAIPLALERALAQGRTHGQVLRKVLARTLALLVMGVLMVNAEEFNPWYNGLWMLLAYLAMLLAFGGVPEARGRARVGWRMASGLGWLGLAVLAVAYRAPATPESPSPYHLVLGPLFDAKETAWLHHSWWGILGLIGWAYLTAAVFYLLLHRRREWLVGAVGLLTMLYVAGRADYASRLAARGWLDGFRPVVTSLQDFYGVVGAHVSIGESLGSLAAITMAGCCLGAVLLPSSGVTTVTDRLRWGAVFAGGLGVAALLFDPLFGLNKIHGTPAWCLLCAALTAATWLALSWLMDLRGWTGWSGVVRPAGANPLLAYLLHPLLYAVGDLAGVHVDFYHNPAWPLAVNIGGSLLMALLVVQATGWLAKTGYRLKV